MCIKINFNEIKISYVSSKNKYINKPSVTIKIRNRKNYLLIFSLLSCSARIKRNTSAGNERSSISYLTEGVTCQCGSRIHVQMSVTEK